MKETIIAISTALQEGAISILRLSGDEAIEIANRIVKCDLHQQQSHTIRYTMAVDPITYEEVDEVMVSVFYAPKSFTCENVVEINCHGGVYITRRILSCALAAGARLALQGEFTQRAFLNGRIDLTQAESIMDLIHAEDELSAQMALNGLKGSVKKLIAPLCDDLVQIIAHIEVNIDYPEYEDVEQLTQDTVLPKAQIFLWKLKDILSKAKSGRIMKQGVKTVILGKPNVGKSSLLNALIEEEKAIVTEIAGTTRDIVEGIVRLQSVTLHMIDTAGIRDTNDIVEQIGIQKSLQMLDEAELVLVLLDGSKALDTQDYELLEITKGKERIIVTNKKDCGLEVEEGILISAIDHDIQPLIDEINQRFEKHGFATKEPVLNNDRQIALVETAYQNMRQAIDALENGIELDLVTIDMQAAYQSLKEIMGEATREDLLNEMFSRFCLGK